MDEQEDRSSDLVLESSLQVFFYDRLIEVNKKFLHPLPNEVIYYSSIVMDRFGESKNYFQKSKEGKITEKILGQKLLKSVGLPKNKKIGELKEIGDTALFLCGYFSDSLNRKLIDTSYYQQIGQVSYSRLNEFLPIVFDFQDFYNFIAKSFLNLVTVIGLVAQKCFSQSQAKDNFVLFVPKKIKLNAS